MITRSNLYFIVAVIFFYLQGCATLAVRNLGVTHESIDRCNKVYVGHDGAVALFVRTRVYKEGPAFEKYKYHNRIIFGSREAVMKSFTNDVLPLKGKLFLKVAIADDGLNGWQPLPLFDVSDTELTHLPISFQNENTQYNTCEIQYTVGGKEQIVSLGNFSFYNDGHYLDNKIETSLWHYPAQVLLIPAFVFDLATSPIQYIIISREFSKSFKQ